MGRLAPVLMLCLAPFAAAAAGAGVTVGDFAASGLDGWKTREFDGSTEWTVVEEDGRRVVRALAEDSASALYREVDIDPAQTPYLQWSWKVSALPSGEASERTKAGDDYGARIYVVREGFFGKLTAQALNFVWSRREPVGAQWPNAFTGRALMEVVDSGTAGVGRWVAHTVDIRRAWREAFGDDVEHIDGVAIMTDTDNTDSTATAFYGDIRFLSDDPGGD